MSEATSDGMVPIDTMHGDDVDTRAIVIWGLVCVLITVATIAGLHAVYNTVAAEQRVAKDYDVDFAKSADIIDTQLRALQEKPRWMDTEGKSVGVPIDRAMTIVVEEFSQQ